MIYTTCKYAPEELFAGFGSTTQRLDPNPVSFSCADGCAHPNLCGFAKAIIEEVRAREIRELIFTDCCDAMRRTYDVLAREQMDFLYFLPLPHKTGEREIRLFANQLRALSNAYAEYSGKRFEWQEALRACIRGSQAKETGNEAPDYVTVLGAHGGKMLLETVRETFGGIEVRDETCSGNRKFFVENRQSDEKSDSPSLPQSEDDFFVWYAKILLTGLTPCMRMYQIDKGRRLVKDTGRKGIIYHTVKFCDYYSFEYADLKNTADAALLKIETDTTPQSSGQLKTRIEAFGETLGVGSMRIGKLTAASGEGRAVMTAGAKKKKFSETARCVAGIDSGSTSTDVVIMNQEKKILGTAIIPTGMSASKSAKEALEIALKEAGMELDQLDEIVATGYGRDTLEMEKRTITEITCHAKGAHFLFPGVRTIIDIGGQDSKVIRIDEQGNVLNFIMNDKCAAGTGRFLEMQARALGLSMEDMSRRGLTWKREVQISNMCTVFAESEVVSLVAQDTAIEDIIHGLNQSVAAKTVSLIQRGKGEPDYAMTGGVSRNQGVVLCLEKKLNAKVHISEQSQLCGAIGAALLGIQKSGLRE